MSDDFNEFKDEAVKILTGLEKYDDDTLVKIIGFALVVAIDNVYHDLVRALEVLDTLHSASQKYLARRRPECSVSMIDTNQDGSNKIDPDSVSVPTSVSDGKPMSAEQASELHQKLMSGEFPVTFSGQTRKMMEEYGMSEGDIKDLLARSLRKTLS
jgi:hypothetical protein